MDTKLTLSIEEEIIRKSKQYANKDGISLSKLIENYLLHITKGRKEDSNITPLVKSLLYKIVVHEDFDFKKDYGKYLDEKYNQQRTGLL